MKAPLFILQPGSLIILSAGMLLDLVLGDPENLPHPVRLMGRLIVHGERLAREIPLNGYIQGMIMSLVLVTGTFCAVHWLIESLSPFYYLKMAFSVLLLYYSLSLKCLAREAMSVRKALDRQGIGAARKRIARLVGRQTSQMDKVQIITATIETVSENLVDGILSPLFFAAMGGPAGAMAYKMVNTLDSMVGYKNRRYAKFGFAAARLDDLCNFLPARLSVLVVALAALILPGYKDPLTILRISVKDSKKHSSPNSGWPESAFAATLGVRLGGPAIYFGREIRRKFINETGSTPKEKDIDRAVYLLFASSFIFFALMSVLGI